MRQLKKKYMTICKKYKNIKNDMPAKKNLTVIERIAFSMCWLRYQPVQDQRSLERDGLKAWSKNLSFD